MITLPLLFTILIRVLVLAPDSTPVRGAWVEVEHMGRACERDTGICFDVQQLTDSRGVFIVELPKTGLHTIKVHKAGYVPYSGQLDSSKGDMTIRLLK